MSFFGFNYLNSSVLYILISFIVSMDDVAAALALSVGLFAAMFDHALMAVLI